MPRLSSVLAQLRFMKFAIGGGLVLADPDSREAAVKDVTNSPSLLLCAGCRIAGEHTCKKSILVPRVNIIEDEFVREKVQLSCQCPLCS